MHSFPSKKPVHISKNFAEYHSCEYKVYRKMLTYACVFCQPGLISTIYAYSRQLIRKSDARFISFFSSFFTDFHLAANRPLHRGAFFKFLFRWIHYCHSIKFTGKETGKTHLCALCYFLLVTWYVDHVQPNVKNTAFMILSKSSSWPKLLNRNGYKLVKFFY